MQRNIMHMSSQIVQLIMAMLITQWQVAFYKKNVKFVLALWYVGLV